MRRNGKFELFLSAYIWGGALTGAIIGSMVMIVILIVSYHWSVQPAKYKNEFYRVIQGKETRNKEVGLAASIIREIVNNNRPIEEHLDNLGKLLATRKGFYLSLLIAEKDKIIATVRGTTFLEYYNINQIWRKIFVWTTVICYLIFVVAVSINIYISSDSDYTTYTTNYTTIGWPSSHDYHTVRWLWRYKWLSYPVILLISPILALYLLIKVIFGDRTLRSPILPETAKKSINLTTKPPMIEEIKERTDETRKRWLELCSKRPELKMKSLRESVGATRTRLSRLGQEVGKLQRELATKQNDLKEWEEIFEKKVSETEEDNLRDFNLLLSFPEVKAIEILGKVIFLYTYPILIKYEEKTYRIGEMFKIGINIETKKVTVENLATTHPLGFCHPYASGTSFCFGGLTNSITAALDEGENVVAARYILTAISSAEGDRPESVKEWQEIKEAEDEVLKTA